MCSLHFRHFGADVSAKIGGPLLVGDRLRNCIMSFP